MKKQKLNVAVMCLVALLICELCINYNSLRVVVAKEDSISLYIPTGTTSNITNPDGQVICNDGDYYILDDSCIEGNTVNYSITLKDGCYICEDEDIIVVPRGNNTYYISQTIPNSGDLTLNVLELKLDGNSVSIFENGIKNGDIAKFDTDDSVDIYYKLSKNDDVIDDPYSDSFMYNKTSGIALDFTYDKDKIGENYNDRGVIVWAYAKVNNVLYPCKKFAFAVKPTDVNVNNYFSSNNNSWTSSNVACSFDICSDYNVVANVYNIENREKISSTVISPDLECNNGEYKYSTNFFNQQGNYSLEIVQENDIYKDYQVVATGQVIGINGSPAQENIFFDDVPINAQELIYEYSWDGVNWNKCNDNSTLYIGKNKYIKYRVGSNSQYSPLSMVDMHVGSTSVFSKMDGGYGYSINLPGDSKLFSGNIDCTLYDEAGNISTFTKNNFMYDDHEPTLQVSTIGNKLVYDSSDAALVKMNIYAEVGFSISASDYAENYSSDIESVCYRLNGGTWHNASDMGDNNYEVYISTENADIYTNQYQINELNTNGINKVEILAYDKAGNASEIYERYFLISADVPVTEYILTRKNINGESVELSKDDKNIYWTNSNVNVELSDSRECIAEIEYSYSISCVNGNGESVEVVPETIVEKEDNNYSFTINIGELEEKYIYEVKINAINRVNGGRFSRKVYVQADCSAPQSIFLLVSGSDKSNVYTFLEDSTWYTDANMAYEISVDSKKYISDRLLDTGSVYEMKYKIENITTGESSGDCIFTERVKEYLVKDGIYVITTWTEDLAGNCSEKNVSTIHYDSVEPTIDSDIEYIDCMSGRPLTSDNIVNGCYVSNNNVAIDFTVNTGISGVEKVEYSLVGDDGYTKTLLAEKIENNKYRGIISEDFRGKVILSVTNGGGVRSKEVETSNVLIDSVAPVINFYSSQTQNGWTSEYVYINASMYDPTEKKQNSSSTSKNTSSNTTGGATTSEAPTTSESTEYVPTAWSPSAEEIVQAVKDKAASLGKPDAYTHFYNRFNEALQESFLEPKRINLGGKIYYDPQTPLDEMWAEQDHGLYGGIKLEYPPYNQDASNLRETPEDIKNMILHDFETLLSYNDSYWVECHIDSNGCYCFVIWVI